MTTTTGTATVTAGRRHRSATRRLLVSELKLLARDPMTLTFVLVFPIVTMLVVGGSFGTEADAAFPVDPTQWYVASYVSVVIGATGLVMLPVHIASYRERGVLRRLAVAGFPRWSFALAQMVVGLLAIVVSVAALLAVAAPVYGVPVIQDPGRVLAAGFAGAMLFVAIGVLLGTLLPSARAAQALGLVLYFPSFLLGGGGPPTAVMTDALSAIAGKMPLSLVTESMRGPWLGLGDETSSLVIVAGLAVVATVLAARRTAL